MGGVLESSLGDGAPFLLGEESARNHRLDSAAANFVLRRCQVKGPSIRFTDRRPSLPHAEFSSLKPFAMIFAREWHVARMLRRPHAQLLPARHTPML